MAEKKYILTKETTEKKIRRMALEVIERNEAEVQLVLVGIKENGVVLANKIAQYMQPLFKGEIMVCALSLDKKSPGQITITPDIDGNNKVILLIDDVANSGKTMLYALKPFLNAMPKKIQTLALVERTHKSFPIDVDYVGLSISTTVDEHIFVEVIENDIAGAWVETVA